VLDAQVIKAVLAGDAMALRKALQQGGHPNSLLTKFIGEKILELGIASIDFSIRPAIHLAVYLAKKEQLDIATMLHRYGADLYAYELSTSLSSGYPPAMMYSLGIGKDKPQNSDAGFLHRLLTMIPEAIDISQLNPWLVESDYPPLLQLVLSRGFFDGVYVVVEYLQADVNEQDQRHHLVAALHVAAWYGDSNSIKYLISRGANPTLVDSYNRTALHYAVMRGYALAISAFFSHTTGNTIYENVTKEELCSSRDLFDMMPVDYAIVDPVGQSWLSSVCQPWISGDGKIISSNGKRYAIDKVYGQQLSSEVFLNQYYASHRPLHITDASLFAKQAIWAYSDPVPFIQRFDDVISPIVSGPTLHLSDRDDSWRYDEPLNMSLQSFFTLIDGSWEWEGRSQTIDAEDVVDIQSPSIFEHISSYDIKDASSQTYRFVIGGQNSGCPMTSVEAGCGSWHLLLSGQKHWYILPPGYRYAARGSDGLLTSVKVWKLEVLPSLRSEGIVYELDQLPGEVVFIPHGWNYATDNLLLSISIEQELCTMSSYRYTYAQPIAVKLYGRGGRFLEKHSSRREAHEEL
jgi:hypothetical protein